MMTKPLAILKDSLREAWDSKTLLVMLVLAGLFLIGVASIGYEPAAPKSVFEDYAHTLSAPVVWIDHGKKPAQARRQLMSATLTTFKTNKEANHAPSGEYEFTVVVKSADGFDKGIDLAVALWHEDGSGKFVKVDKDENPNIANLKPNSEITDEMMRDYLAGVLELQTMVPVSGFERLPDAEPGERVYKISTGPSKEPRVWPVTFSVAFGAWESPAPLPLGILLYVIQDYVLNSIGGLIIILIAVIVTAFFIPNMLRPGTVVMLLSKPINRTTLLLFKYFGGLFFVAILATFTVGGVWLITGVRAGVWAPGIFAVVPLMTLTFAILYAVSTVTAVWTRNSIVAILVTLAVAGFLWLVGKVEFFAQATRVEADALATIRGEEAKYPTWAKVAGSLDSVLPRWHDIDVLTGHVIMDSLMTLKQMEARGASNKHLPSWAGTIAVTGGWIALLLGLACWRFSVKDY
jgi:ABC-type transport system involved in multi-copper enzyme maturation permease subunit